MELKIKLTEYISKRDHMELKIKLTGYISKGDHHELNPASILRKSTSGRHLPVSYPDGPMTARYRFT